jgi:hypothetical protein
MGRLRRSKRDLIMVESKKSTKLPTYAHVTSGDYKKVDASYLAQLEKSVEQYVVPAIDRAQKVKETRAQNAKRLRVD